MAASKCQACCPAYIRSSPWKTRGTFHGCSPARWRSMSSTGRTLRLESSCKVLWSYRILSKCSCGSVAVGGQRLDGYATSKETPFLDRCWRRRAHSGCAASSKISRAAMGEDRGTTLGRREKRLGHFRNIAKRSRRVYTRRHL